MLLDTSPLNKCNFYGYFVVLNSLHITVSKQVPADRSDHAVQGIALRPLAC